jgi:hypothetical protein
MTNTKFDFEGEQRGRSKLAVGVLVGLIVAVLAVAGYLVFRIVGVKEDEIVIEPVTVSEESQTEAGYFDVPPPTQEEVLVWEVPSDQPRFMSIKAIGLDKVRVEAVGRNAQNAVDIPANVWNAAWFRESAKPGAAGAGLYDCHTFFGVGSGLCDNLGKLSDGDEIVIERGDGIKYVYGVVEIRDLSVREANEYMGTLLKVPEGQGATQSISIVTCAGNYDTGAQTADRRVTVRAVLVR